MKNIKVLQHKAISRTLFPKTELKSALRHLQYVQADPIRAPARSQDLVLRHRVTSYFAGDLERQYPHLEIEEDVLQTYGFMTRDLQAHLHPRTTNQRTLSGDELSHHEAVLEFVTQNGPTHPNQLAKQFGKKRVTNDWGGSSMATTKVLEMLHYEGKLRVAHREKGIKVFEKNRYLEACSNTEGQPAAPHRLIHFLLQTYAPLTASSLRGLVRMLNYGAPNLRQSLSAALEEIQKDAPKITLENQVYLCFDDRQQEEPEDKLRFLSPFDPIVWDRKRFLHLWGWEYRLEAYTPSQKRKLGYYALPILWNDQMVGWANLQTGQGKFEYTLHYPHESPKGARYRSALNEELEAMHHFLYGSASH